MFGTQLPEQKMQSPGPGDKTLWGVNFTVFFFPGFPIKYLKAGKGYHLSSVVRQGEGRPSKPSLDYPPPAASDGYDYFSWGGRKMEVLPLGIKVGNDLQMIDA